MKQVTVQTSDRRRDPPSSVVLVERKTKSPLSTGKSGIWNQTACEIVRNTNNLEIMNRSLILMITEIIEKTRQLVYCSPAKNKNEILEILMDAESEVACHAKKEFLANCT